MHDLLSAALAWLAQRTFMDVAELFFVVMTIAGQRLNASRDVRGYYFWVTSNICGVILFLALGRWMTAALYAWLGYECVRGIVTWRRLEQGGRPAAALS